MVSRYVNVILQAHMKNIKIGLQLALQYHGTDYMNKAKQIYFHILLSFINAKNIYRNRDIKGLFLFIYFINK